MPLPSTDFLSVFITSGMSFSGDYDTENFGTHGFLIEPSPNENVKIWLLSLESVDKRESTFKTYLQKETNTAATHLSMKGKADLQ